jgi:YVTN family beta-propeller protein
VSPDGRRVYVANSSDATVSVIDAASGTLITLIPVGLNPIGVAVTPDGSSVYVTNNGPITQTVSVIDTATNSVAQTIGGLPGAASFGQFIGPPENPPPTNYQGLWWNPAESGWGISLAHQGDSIYLTWYTYDAAGRSSWLAMLASRTGPQTYSGDILEVHGSPYNVLPYNPAAKIVARVGTGTLTFTGATTATFDMTAKNVTRSIALTKFSIGGPVPICVYETVAIPVVASNYQDLWWGGPAEDGWGLSIIHEGNRIYAVWYTYDIDGSPLWLASLMTPSLSGDFFGTVLRAAGPPFGPAFDPAGVTLTTVGQAMLSFANGNSATLSYTVGMTSGNKSLTRFMFAAPAGTICQ